MGQYFECEDYYGIFCQTKNIEPDKAKKMKPKQLPHKASSDIGQIKNNYNKNQKLSIVAPPAPLDEPQKKEKPNLMEQDIESMGFIQLKARCGMEGLSTFGTKKQLLARLRLHLNPNKPISPKSVITKPSINPKHKKNAYSTSVNAGRTTSNTPTSPKTKISPKFKIAPKSPKTQPISPKISSNLPTTNTTKVSGFNPSEDDLHDLDPTKDDFFKPIATVNDEIDSDDEIRAGSVVVN